MPQTTFRNTKAWTCTGAVLAATLYGMASPAAVAENLRGTLEKGNTHSVLWTVSPETGDLIGQVFANQSPAGQTILARCLPELACAVGGAQAISPDSSLTDKLIFSAQPSGWWLITQALEASPQGSLPMMERELVTRFGQLSISEEHMLLFNGQPVLDSPPPRPVAQQPDHASPSSPGPQPTLWTRLREWWGKMLRQLHTQLLTLLGQSTPAPETPPPQVMDATPATRPTPQPASGTVQVVQGNAALHIVAHLEQPSSDTVLLQDSGGALCPARYRFATFTAQGLTVTPAFGTCSDIAAVNRQTTAQGYTDLVVTMLSFEGADNPSEGPTSNAPTLRRYALHRGQVQEHNEGTQH